MGASTETSHRSSQRFRKNVNGKTVRENVREMCVTDTKRASKIRFVLYEAHKGIPKVSVEGQI